MVFTDFFRTVLTKLGFELGTTYIYRQLFWWEIYTADWNQLFQSSAVLLLEKSLKLLFHL